MLVPIFSYRSTLKDDFIQAPELLFLLFSRWVIRIDFIPSFLSMLEGHRIFVLLASLSLFSYSELLVDVFFRDII